MVLVISSPTSYSTFRPIGFDSAHALVAAVSSSASVIIKCFFKCFIMLLFKMLLLFLYLFPAALPSLQGEGLGVGSVSSPLTGYYRPHPRPLPYKGGESGGRFPWRITALFALGGQFPRRKSCQPSFSLLFIPNLYIFAREKGAVSPASRRRRTSYPSTCPSPSWPPIFPCCREWCAGQRQLPCSQ